MPGTRAEDVSNRSSSQKTLARPFLKWAGNKFRILPHLLPILPQASVYVEPFAGSAALFVNVDCDKYFVSDLNGDLIFLYQTLQREGVGFIEYARTFFCSRTNSERKYYELRAKFNSLTEGEEKAALFLYLNRHGYNGLCRYNSKGIFNVPFGRYLRPYFPEREMLHFLEKAKKAVFSVRSFEKSIALAPRGSVIYADPPYLPISTTASFTKYAQTGFSLEDHSELARLAADAAENRGCFAVISNHDLPVARKIYRGGKIVPILVRRTISCLGTGRVLVPELIVSFGRAENVRCKTGAKKKRARS